MFVTYAVHISQPIHECIAAVRRGPQAWFPALEGDRSARVGIKVAGIQLRKRVAVELGQLVMEGDSAEVPINWKATVATPFFPIFNGTIRLVPVDPTVTRMTISCLYKAPLGRLGLELDEAFMHNVAAATVKELAESISAQLTKVPTRASRLLR
jgi:hypothetical protein